MIHRLMGAGLTAVVAFSVASPTVAQDGGTRILQGPNDAVAVVLPDGEEVLLDQRVTAAIEDAVNAGSLASIGGGTTIAASLRRIDDQPLDFGTSQPLPREIINLDQAIERALVAEQIGDAGPAAGGTEAASSSDTVAAETFDEAVFDVRESETFSPTGN